MLQNIEKFTEIWLEKCSKQFLLSSGVLSCNKSALFNVSLASRDR